MITVSRMLWAYHINKGWDIVNGKKVEAHVSRADFQHAFKSGPTPFKVAFVPRDEKVPEIIRRDFAATEKSAEVILERIGRAQQTAKAG